MSAHISEKIEEYLARNNWIWARDAKGVTATKNINFKHLSGAVTNGDRLVKLVMDNSGRWLEVIDGFGTTIADIDLRNYSEKTGFEAVRDVIQRAYGSA